MSTLRRISLLLLVPLSLTGPSTAQIVWTDVTSTALPDPGSFFSSTAHSLGVSWIDFDVDGLPDLFAVGGDGVHAPRLYRNEGDGTFSDAQHLLPTLPAVEMSGAQFADYDRDGDPDLFIYAGNSSDWALFSLENPLDGSPDLLLRNRLGEAAPDEPLFEEVAAAAGVQGLADPPFGALAGHHGKAAAWLDYDLDGCIDLYVGSWALNRDGSSANRDRLYRNLCDGTFEDASVVSGVQPGIDSETYRATLVVGGFHLDADRLPDLYVISTSAVSPSPWHDDFIFRNNGPNGEGDTTFSEVGSSMPGVGDDAQAGMGIDVADIDLDGDWDVYLSDLFETEFGALPHGNVLYLGDGAGGFEDNSAPEAGISAEGSWGVNFFDMDHDGWEDLFVGTRLKHFYRNLGTDAQGAVSFQRVLQNEMPVGGTRGTAVADYDGDGDLDVAAVHQDGGLIVLRNDSTRAGSGLSLGLTGTVGNLDAIGAIVEARTGEIVRRRQMKGGASVHSQDEFLIHFGLGAAQAVDELMIFWPSGRTTTLLGVAAEQRLDVDEEELFRAGFESGALPENFVLEAVGGVAQSAAKR